MSRPLSLFPSFKSAENTATNNVGVLLRILHQQSPSGFVALCEAITGEQLTVGPTFTQQTRAGEGVPDLLITQSAFAVHFETKRGSAFDEPQLRRHVDALRKLPLAAGAMKILVALGNHEGADFAQKHGGAVAYAEKAAITLVSLSFEELLEHLRDATAPPSFAELVNEFAVYLDTEGLLPRWKYRLTAIPCGNTLDEFAAGAYMCPNTGGAYSHQRARFFGAYTSKAVQSIAQVRARVVLPADGSAPEVDWVDDKARAKQLIEEARDTIAKSSVGRRDEATRTSLQVFLLGDRHATSFEKRSPGGAQNKRYFSSIAKPNETAEQLAARLRGKAWSDFD